MFLIKIFTIILVIGMIIPLNTGLIFAEPQIKSNQIESQAMYKFEKTLEQKIQTLEKLASRQSYDLTLSLASISVLKTETNTIQNVEIQIFSKLTIPPIHDLLLSLYQTSIDHVGVYLVSFLDKITSMNYLIPNAYAVAPVANNDKASTTQNTPVTIPVLSNDTDVDNDTLTILSFTSPSHGTANDINYTSQFGSTGSGDGQFNTSAEGIAIDSSGNSYVVEFNANRVQKFNSTGTFQSKFGTSGSGNGQFNGPYRIAIDSSGNLYVTDSGHNRIQKFDSSGNFTSIIGSTGSGNGQFNQPYGIAIDSSDNIYVTDSGNNRIEKFNSTGGYQSQFGTSGSSNGQFQTPEGITVDSSDNIYVADAGNNRVQKFNSTGTFQSKFGTFGSSNGLLSSPHDVAVDSSGSIYVLDSGNNRIQKFDSTGTYVSQFGSFGSGIGQFNSPHAFTLDSSGSLYVSDFGNNRIQKLNTRIMSYTPNTNFAGYDSFTYTISDGHGGTSSASVIITVPLLLSDSISMSDAVAAQRSSSHTLSDSISLSDQISITKLLHISLSESLDMSDSVSTTYSSPDFIASSIRSVNATQGNLGTSNISLSSVNGFSGSVTLALQNLPSGVSGTFARNNLDMASGFNETGFTLHLAPSVASGTYSFDVNATRGLISHTTTFTLNVFPQASSTPSAVLGTLYGTDASAHHLLSISKLTGHGTIIGSFGNGSFPALAIDPTTGMMYVGEGGGTPYLFRVNPSTGAKVFVGDTGLGFAAIADMAFRRDGTLFATVNTAGDGGSGSDHLVTLNKTTGVATVIGPFGSCTGVFIPSSAEGTCTLEGIEGISFNSTGALYGSSSSRAGTQTPTLYTLNTATGAATVIATILNSTGYPPSGGVVSLIFDGSTLYGGTSRFNNATDGGYLVTINPSTGVFTKIGKATSSSLGALTLFPPLVLSESVSFHDSLSVKKSTNAISISSMSAFDGTGVNTGYGNGLKITILFSEGTNRPGGTSVLNKTAVDNIFTFSQNLGTNYQGQWTDTRTFVITILDSTGSTPPTIGGLTSTVKQSANLLNLAETSMPSISTSPPLSGTFGSKPGPFITGLVVNDPSGLNPTYSNGDTITARFSESTNQPIGTGVLNKGSVDSLFTFSQNLGDDYNGQWTSSSTFVITVLDSSHGTVTIGGLQTTVKSGAGLKNSVGTSLVSTSTSPVLSGHFGNQPGPTMLDLVASDPTGSLGSYSNGTSITIRFAQPTNTFDPTPTISGLSKSDLDALFAFTQNLGNDYAGQWVDPSTIVITITDSRHSTPPTIGGLQVTVIGNIRDSSGLSVPSTSTSPSLSGSFGTRSGPSIVSLVASDPTVKDAVYSNGDTITMTFAESTNRTGGSGILNKGSVDSLFTFSQNLGTDYVGQWINPSTFVITILDSTGATPPTIGGLQTTVIGHVGNFAGTSRVSASISPPLTGSFGDRPGPFITELIASDPTGSHGVFSNGVTITAKFSELTNQPGGTSVLNKASVDNLFTFSQNLGGNYNGQWINPSTFVITILDSTGATPPTVGGLSATIKPGANLKNAPGISLVSISTSPGLSGSFGSRQGPTITNFIADDPTETHNSYSDGINMTIIFSEQTNRPGGTSVLNKASVDNLFTFSQNLGTDYVGQWINPSVFVIQIRDSTGATPPSIGVLVVTVKQSANLQNIGNTSLASTSISPLLAGTFGTFTVSIPVADGGSAVTTLPSGIIAGLTLPAGNEGTIQITRSSVSTDQITHGATVNFLGNVADIIPQSGANCSAGCGISFTFSQSDADSFGISPFDVKIYHDLNENGIFESNEVVSTTVTQIDVNTFLASSNIPFNSKFAIGGVVTALAVLGAHGGDSGSSQAFSAQGFLSIRSLSQIAKDSIQNEDPYVPLKPSSDPSVPYYPFTLDGNNYLLARYANTIETVTEKVGTPIPLQLTSSDKTILHVALYMNMEGLSKEIGDSDTYIVYEKGNPLQIVDPHGFFSDVKIKTTTEDDVGKFDFIMTFAKPMQKSNIFIREWNEIKYSSDTKIKDAIVVIESPQNTQISKDLIPDKAASQTISSIPTVVSSTTTTGTGDIMDYIKQWGGYSSISISDSQLLDHMGIKGTHIPYWFMKNTKWVVTGDASQQEFTEAINYMYDKGIIK